MHLTRAESTKKLPIERKTTKYIARALSHKNESVSIVIAVRDMLKLARTSKEVKYLIQQKLLKINGREVKDFRESIRLFNILSAGKQDYKLSILPSGRFSLMETKDKYRLVKVIGKNLLRKKVIQFNLHDGTNFLGNEKIKIGNSLELDFSGKVKNIIELSKGKNIFIFSGKSIGKIGKIEEVVDKKAKIKLDDKTVELNVSHLIAIN